MTRISFACIAAFLLLIPGVVPAAEAAPEDIVDLIANPAAAKNIVLPRLRDSDSLSAEEARRLTDRGKVILGFVVTAGGTVVDVKIAKPAKSYRLNDIAVATMLSRSYVPATRDGKPVAVRIWAIDSFNADPDEIDEPLDAATDIRFSCRFGTHRVAVDACSALLAAGKIPAQNILALRARGYEELGEYTKAIADYDRLLALVPPSGEMLRHRGLAYEAVGQYARAIEDYDHAIANDSTGIAAYLDRGFAYEGLGQHDRAAADYKAAMAHRPQCQTLASRGIGNRWSGAGYHPSLGDVGFSPGWSGVAVPDDGGSLPVLGTIPTEIRSTTVKSAPCESADVPSLESIPDIAATDGADEALQHEQRCRARAMWGKELYGALADCDRALQLNPDFIRASEARGLVRFRMGDNAGAVKDFDVALAGNPGLASSLYVRGLAKAKAGDMTGAGTDIRAARSIDPQIAEYFVFYQIAPWSAGR